MAVRGCLGIVFVEGNIGVGKTTLLRGLLNRRPNILVIEEPTHIWLGEHSIRGLEDKNLLKLFYEKTISPYAFQEFIRESTQAWYRKKWDQWNINHQTPPEFILIERSPAASYFVFCPEVLTPDELAIYGWARNLQGSESSVSFPTKRQNIIYLAASVKTLRERIVKRNRAEEVAHVTSEYLERLEKRYANFIGNQQKEGDKLIIKLNTEETSAAGILQSADDFLTLIKNKVAA